MNLPSPLVRRLFDSHLDLSWNALSFNRDQTLPLDELNRRESHMRDCEARGRATTSLPELRDAGVAVCLATLLVRAKPEVQPDGGHRRTDLDFASQEIAYAMAQGQLAYYRLLESRGEMRMLRTRDELRAHWELWQGAETARLPVGYILAMEGCDPIVEPAQAEAWWEAGLRSAMLAHYGRGYYAMGTGEQGSLTAAGRELLAQFERLGMILDVTHLAEPGWWEALDLFSGPVMASHNNCRALVPGDRQFSDEQLRRLFERDAVIGVVLDAWMLLPGWVRKQSRPEEVGLSALADQIDHLCQLAGNVRHAALGTDLDGGYGTEQTPHDLKRYTDLWQLVGILRGRGYSDQDLEAIFWGNWLRFFLEHLPT